MPQTLADRSILAANLGGLGERNADLARKLDGVSSRPDVVFAGTPQGVASVALGSIALCSRHRPLDEADRLVERVDLVEHAVVVVLGFAAGYHVQRLAERLGRAGVIVVFEPDLALLRAVLETIDHSAWLRDAQVIFVTDAADRGTLAGKLQGAESIIAQGVAFLDHPPSRPRLGAMRGRLMENVGELVKATKTTFLTTLMRSVDTVRNLLTNIDHYAAGNGIMDLRDAAAGHPAVVVSAGPSLHRNLHLLAEPKVRERCVIICAQTTLRPLLAAGVQPHFVTALDFHEISRRFYEDLPDAAARATLVAEPKAHRVILEAFPGPVRCCANPLLDQVLGEELKRPMGDLPAGATVAHLAVYLARWLGCDPIMLVGQDLGFTDGLYYLPGTAIESVWAPELNAFNTMEMMQWQRIARHRAHLSRARDLRGRTIFTDAQMLAYLHQFERDFAACAEAGVRIIDATEGGLPKQHTAARSLADALAEHATRPLPALPAARPGLDPDRLAAARSRVAAVTARVAALRETSRKTARLLRRMSDDRDDPARMKRHFRELEPLRRRVEQDFEAFEIVNHLNQLGVYKRFKTDRRLHMQAERDPRRRQAAQLRRDLQNVSWTADAAAEVAGLLERAEALLAGETPPPGPAAPRLVAARPPATRSRIEALIPVDPHRNGLGLPRSLAAPFGGRPVLAATLERLGRCRRLDGIVLIVPRGFDVEALIDRGRIDLPVTVEPCAGSPYGPEQAAVAAARRWSPTCWRGGIAGMSVYDEVLCPAAMHEIMQRRGLTAALLAGPDWPLIDVSDLTGCDAVIARHLELPDKHTLVFTQAPPGLCGCLVSAGLMRELALRNRLSTIGAMLVYQPHLPQHDPIARSVNVQIDHRVRGSRARATFDVPRYRRGLDPIALDAGPVTVVETLERRRPEPPAHLVLELSPRRRGRGRFRPPVPAGDRPDLALDAARRFLDEAAPDSAVTLGGAGDPLLHEHFDEIVGLARDRGLPVHVRTELLEDTAMLDRLLACGPDVVSVDLNADCPETYRRMMGLDEMQRAVAGIQHLVANRRALTPHSGAAALALPWIVPRLQRCAATLDDIDGFYDRWQGHLGCAVVDGAPAEPAAGEDLLPTPTPAAVAADLARVTRTILSDGTVAEPRR